MRYSNNTGDVKVAKTQLRSQEMHSLMVNTEGLIQTFILQALLYWKYA